MLAMIATSYACLAISMEYLLLSNSSMGIIKVNELTDRVLPDSI
jgi:hypothetical protein